MGIILNDEQRAAYQMIQVFLRQNETNTFLLKGYAGTGKTCLMQRLAGWLKEKDQKFVMLASTGRAATVLRGKTGFAAKTVHGELYNFNKVNGDDETISNDAPLDKFGQMILQFNLRRPDEEHQVYIVDEASMLSSEFNDNPFATFGTGVLLEDFFNAIGRNKVIFVGDPCQLPPVGQTISPALDIDWLKSQHRTVQSTTLQKIERTDTDILLLATAVRDLSQQTMWERFPRLPARNKQHVKLYSTDDALFKEYLDHFKKSGTAGALAVVRSNKTVQYINDTVRADLYGARDKPLQTGDILLVIQNNYVVPLTNGDFVIVTSLGEVHQHINLHFQSVRIKAVLSEMEYEILLSLDVLYGSQVNFSQVQMKALMVDFSRRMRNKGIMPNSQKYKEAMMEDSYLNCLRATYGYAVTCHKAQGGEWDNVFLFLDKGMYGMPRPELCRWWYTAITRARKNLHMADEWWISG